MKHFIPPDGRKFFGMLDHLIDEDSLQEKRIEARKMLKKRIAAYIKDPQTKVQKRIAAYTKASDLAVTTTPNPAAFYDVEEYDLGFQPAYLDASRHLDKGKWEITTGKSDVVMLLTPEGKSVKIDSQSSSVISVGTEKYTAGLGITDEMIRHRSTVQIEEKAKALKDAYWIKLADGHYGLLADSSSETVASDNQAGTTWQEKWIRSISTVANKILTGLKDTRGPSPLARVLMFVDAAAMDELAPVLKTIMQPVVGSPTLLQRNVDVIYTYNSAITGIPIVALDQYSFLMVYPQNKIQRVNELEPTMFTVPDYTTFTEVTTMLAYYGAAVADKNQIKIGGLKAPV